MIYIYIFIDIHDIHDALSDEPHSSVSVRMAQLAAAPSLLHIHLIQLLLQAFLEGVVLQPLIGAWKFPVSD